MTVQNLRFISTLQALEDLRECQYHAVALDDGLLANNGEEASGILINKPYTHDHLSLAYVGELKFAAGGAIAKGAKITVTTSGWFTTAGSLDPVVGEAKAAVTSGSFGTGLFAFPAAQAPATGITHEVTALCTIVAALPMPGPNWMRLPSIICRRITRMITAGRLNTSSWIIPT